MTTIHRRIGTPAVTGYKARGRLRLSPRIKNILVFVAFNGAFFLAGVIYHIAITPEVSFLQSQLRTAYADNNKAQSAMGEQLTFITESEYGTGWRDGCMALGQDEDYCTAHALDRAEARP